MRTIRGLERVDVIYRRINDTFLDPECFDKDSALGVPGLMRAWRAGNVALANAPGAGVADDKVVYAYVPQIIEYYLGEKAILPNVPTLLLRDAESRKRVLGDLSQWVVKPANESGGYGMLIGPRATDEEKAAMAAAVEANPRNYIAQPVLALSTAPTLVQGEIEPRHLDLAAVHPARPRRLGHAGRPHARRAAARLAGRELVARRRQQGHLDRGGEAMSLLSRVAERIYWTARYLERAETTSRLARVYGNLLLDLPREAGLSWDVLVQITGGGDRYRELHPSPSVDTAERFFVADRDNPSSVRSSLAFARESVRTTRDIVPSEAWRSINELCLWVTQELDAETSHRRRYGIHSRVVERCQQISGLLADTMSHDAAYQFFRLGRGIERADMTTRIIDVAAAMLLGRENLARFDNTLWMAVLQSLSAYQMYRQKVRRRIYGPDVIAYLLEGHAVSARDRVQHARDRSGARDAAAQRRARSRSSATCAACWRCATWASSRSRSCISGSTTRSSSSASCTGSSRRRGSGRRRRRAPGQTPRRTTQSQSQSQSQPQSQSPGSAGPSSSAGVSALGR